jgi:hypothetical protein
MIGTRRERLHLSPYLASEPEMRMTRYLEIRASLILRTTSASRVAVVLLSQGSQTLLLGVGIDVCTNDKGNDVEEGYPGLLREELLGKGESQRRGAPADFHDGE